ncbi:hypothetical protein [Azospirillum palustre]
MPAARPNEPFCKAAGSLGVLTRAQAAVLASQLALPAAPPPPAE